MKSNAVLKCIFSGSIADCRMVSSDELPALRGIPSLVRRGYSLQVNAWFVSGIFEMSISDLWIVSGIYDMSIPDLWIKVGGLNFG